MNCTKSTQFAPKFTCLRSKIEKFFWKGGTALSSDPVGRGTPPPHASPPRRLRRLDLRAFGAQTQRSQSSFLGNDP